MPVWRLVHSKGQYSFSINIYMYTALVYQYCDCQMTMYVGIKIFAWLQYILSMTENKNTATHIHCSPILVNIGQYTVPQYRYCYF